VFGNFAASLGNMVVQNPMVAQSIKELSKAFIGATAAIDGGTSASISFVNRGLISMISGIRDLIPSLNAVMSFMKSISFLFDAMLKGVMSFVDGLKILGNAWIWLVGTMAGKKSALEDIGAAMDRMKKRGDDLAKSLENIGKDAFSKMDLKDFDDALKRIQDAANKKPIEINTKINTPNKIDPGIDWDEYINGKIDEVKIEAIKPEVATDEVKFDRDQLARMGFENWFSNLSSYLDQFILDYNEAGQNPVVLDWNEYVGLPKDGDLLTFFKKAIDGVKAAASYVWNVVPGVQGATYFITKSLFEVGYNIKKNLPAIITGITGGIQGLIAAMGEGAEGAKKAIPEALSKMTTAIGAGVGSIWGPLGSSVGQGIGGIVGEQIKLAAQPIGDTLKSIDEFMAEVPNVLKRITDNLPTIMNKVFENLPDLLIAIFKALPSIMRASASAMKPLFKEIGKELPSIMQTLLEVAWESIAMVFMAIGYAAQGLALGLFDLIGEKLAAIRDKMTLGFDAIGLAWDTAVNYIKTKLSFFTVDNLMKNINTFLTGIVNIFTKLWNDVLKVGDFLSNFFSNIGGSLSDGFNRGIKEMGDNIGGFFRNFGVQVGSAIQSKLDVSGGGDWLKGVGDTIKKGMSDIFSADFYKSLGQAIIDGFTKLFDKLNPFKSGSNGGGGSNALAVATGGLSKLIPGAATGGMVPPGYPDDNYPALLTSNEVVVPASTTPNLFSLIDKLANNQAPSNQSNDETNQLLRQLIAIIANQQTQVDVKIDRDTLARAILSLNKDNRRLA
jgi:hypothetical protein